LMDGENRQILDSLGRVVDNGIGGKAEMGGSDQQVQYSWDHVDEGDKW
jgi:Na+/H+-translocating membrane pyrophosphatase